MLKIYSSLERRSGEELPLIESRSRSRVIHSGCYLRQVSWAFSTAGLRIDKDYKSIWCMPRHTSQDWGISLSLKTVDLNVSSLAPGQENEPANFGQFTSRPRISEVGRRQRGQTRRNRTRQSQPSLWRKRPQRPALCSGLRCNASKPGWVAHGSLTSSWRRA